jgi:glycosyltransferase involved in cell wall biosynthesis
MTARFSIIVPTLNRKPMLFAALDSIRAQRWPDVEMIVVDGGSTDGTVEAVTAMPDILLLGGPDRGVYDAFNKGIARASGDIVGILNSDDIYQAGAFVAIAEAFAHHRAVDAVCGASVLVRDDDVVAVYDRDADKRLTPRAALIGSCTPNARFFRRMAMKRNGAFNLDYRYVADRDWLMRWHDTGLTTVAIPALVYRYRSHPDSLTFDADRRRETEIRLELLRLARYWQEMATDAQARAIATALEGRCVAYLATEALRNGRPREALRWLTTQSGRASVAPTLAVLWGVMDWSVYASGRALRQRS